MEHLSESKGHFNFSVDSQLISELGERLVTSNYIALSELIKNAYDADSPRVSITLENIAELDVSDEQRKIIIKDSGVGMSASDIDAFWMTIATPHKADKPTSLIYGRPTTGNKGIGRFACQKLAKKLVIESCAILGDVFEHTEVTFEWDKFIPGKEVEKIPCEYKSWQSKTGETGVTLNLLGLRDRWTWRDFQMLQKYVALISVATQSQREGFEEDPGFEAEISCNEFESENFNIGKKTLESGWGTLKGRVDEKGLVSLTLTSAPEKSKAKYKFEGFRGLAFTHFEIHIMPQSSHLGVENRRNPTFLTQKLIGDIWETHSGIRLYLNKFRVYPYGDMDKGDDWLGIARDLSKRRGAPDPLLKSVSNSLGVMNFQRAMLNHPAARAHIGAIFIEDKAIHAFEPKMDREGLVENRAFTELKKMLRVSLDWSALNYEAFLRTEITKKAEEKKKQFIEISGNSSESTRSQVNQAFKVIDKAAEVFAKEETTAPRKNATNELDTTGQSEGKQIVAAINFIESQFNELDAETDTLRSVAATAPLLFVFAHEFKGIIASLLSHAARLEHLSNSIENLGVKQELLGLADDARNSTEQYGKITRLFDVFSDSQNFHKKKVLLKTAVDQVAGGFGYLFSEFGIDFDAADINPVVRMPRLNEAELYSVLINSISNSVKAVIAKSGERKIKIEILDAGANIELSVFDTGVGLAKNQWEDVFKPFVSDPESKIYSSLSSQLGDQQLSTLGKGSGLGLHIMRSIVNKHNGTVTFKIAEDGWKTKLFICIPKSN